MTRRPLVIVFARVPQLGRVKTRLARGIGALAAWQFHRRTLASILGRLRRDGRWDLVIAATPDHLAPRAWRPRGRLPVRRQGHGDLGQRMVRALRAAGRRPVAIVGCDVPELDGAAVGDALRRLAGHLAVFGPSTDGGFWLVGWRGAPPSPRLFAGVRWSTASTLADSVARLGDRRVAVGRTLDDVDDADDLERVRRLPSAGR